MDNNKTYRIHFTFLLFYLAADDRFCYCACMSTIKLQGCLPNKQSSNPKIRQIKVQTMNGRIYDPTLGMFLSPDNNIQAPDIAHNYNRYSYALNNPTRYVDLNGEEIGAFGVILITWGVAEGIWGLSKLIGGEYKEAEGKTWAEKWWNESVTNAAITDNINALDIIVNAGGGSSYSVNDVIISSIDLNNLTEEEYYYYYNERSYNYFQTNSSQANQEYLDYYVQKQWGEQPNISWVYDVTNEYTGVNDDGSIIWGQTISAIGNKENVGNAIVYINPLALSEEEELGRLFLTTAHELIHAQHISTQYKESGRSWYGAWEDVYGRGYGRIISEYHAYDFCTELLIMHNLDEYSRFDHYFDQLEYYMNLLPEGYLNNEK